MGKGSSSSLQVRASAVAVMEVRSSNPGSTSEQAKTCDPRKDKIMAKFSAIIKGDVSISMKIRFAICVFFSALLMVGYLNGLSPSALAYST